MSYRPYAAIIAEAQSANSNLSANMINETGSTIPVLTPVAVDNDGRLALIDVSDNDTVIALAGVTSQAIASNSNGPVSLAGRIVNITTPFAHGDYLYVSKTGGLTNVAPSNGNEITGPINAGVNVTLPNSGQYNGDELMIDINGQTLESGYGFNFVGTPPRTQVAFTFGLVVGDRIYIRKHRD